MDERDLPADATGVLLRCTGCNAEQGVKLEGLGRDQAAMWAHLMVGSPLILLAAPGPESPIGKSECCRAPLAMALLGYAEPGADEPPPPMLTAHLPSSWAPAAAA